MKLDKKNLIFVEGKDDKAFIEELLKEIKLDLQIRKAGRSKELKQELKIISKDKNFSQLKKLLIICDAEQSKENTAISITNMVQDIFGEEPVDIDKESGGRFGYLILPSSEEQGSLEDELFKTIDLEVRKKIENFVNEIQKLAFKKKHKLTYLSKYRIHCYIGYACNDKLYLKLQHAFKNCKAFDFNKFESLRNKILKFLAQSC